MAARPDDAEFTYSGNLLPQGVRVFDQHAQEYDCWFDEREALYQSEVNALRRFVPEAGCGIEIGTGTGRFSVPFDIRLGVEPSRSMARIAHARGIAICQAKGEALPFHDDQFDFALLVTVVCFVSSVRVLFQEVRRVLKPGGRIILGFIDRNSPLGQMYEAHKANDTFYRVARFYSVADIADRVRQTGFGAMQFCQTIFGVPGDAPAIQPMRDGYGEGAFVVLSAKKD